MNWRDNPELLAAVTGSAVHAFYRPQKRVHLTIINFIIGVAVTAVLSPAAHDLLRLQAQSLRSVASFVIGLLAMTVLPAILQQAERRRDAIANKVIGVALNLKDEDSTLPKDQPKTEEKE